MTSCLLCPRPPSYRGIWVPNPATSRRLGAPAGKCRTIAYALCRRCQARRGAMKRVEAKILGQVEVDLGNPLAN